MSLLNDMLKDLDKSQAPNADAAEPTASKKTGNSKLKSLILPALAALLVVYWLLVEMNLLGLIPQKTVQPEPPKPMAANSDWLARMEELKKQKSQAEEGAAPSDPKNEAQKASPESSEEVTRLLRLADHAFADGRLVSPLNDSALPLYTAALALDPENQVARDGIGKVQSSMLSRIDSHMALKNYDKAREQALIAKKMFVEESFLSALEKILEKIESARSSQSTQSASRNFSGERPVHKPASISPAQKDNKLANNIQNQGIYALESKALAWVKTSNEYSQTVIALVDGYHKYQSLSGLENLSRILESKSSALDSYVKANSALLNNDTSTALQLLQQKEYTGPAELARKRLLAGLFQARKQFDQALPLYDLLVNSNEANVNDWLGFAVVCDAQKKSSEALQGYQRVMQLGHPDSQVMQYAETRIKKLLQGG